MDLNTYRQNLDAVIRQFAAPTFELVRALCPHLDADSVRIMLGTALEGNDLLEFAVPSVLVANSYHVLGIAPQRKCSSYLTYCRHKRLPASFASGKIPCDYPEQRRPWHANQAMAYASTMWEHELITDNWKSMLRYNLFRSAHGTGSTENTILYQLGVAVGRSPAEMRADTSRPLAEQLDEAIIRVSHYSCENIELTGGRQICESNNCACCGTSLDPIACKVCGIWAQPLESLPVTAKIRNYLHGLGVVLKTQVL